MGSTGALCVEKWHEQPELTVYSDKAHAACGTGDAVMEPFYSHEG